MPKAMRRKVFTGTGSSHFITFCTYGRRELLGTPRAKQIVISQIGKLAAKGDAKVSGFVIMPDHVHTIFWFDDDKRLPDVMRVWKGTSAHWLRKFFEESNPEFIEHLKVKRRGREIVKFWQQRYYDFNITSHEKLNEKLNYMHNNPVKKGLCERPEDYLWSSARWYKLHRDVGVKIESGF